MLGFKYMKLFKTQEEKDNFMRSGKQLLETAAVIVFIILFYWFLYWMISTAPEYYFHVY